MPIDEKTLEKTESSKELGNAHLVAALQDSGYDKMAAKRRSTLRNNVRRTLSQTKANLTAFKSKSKMSEDRLNEYASRSPGKKRESRLLMKRRVSNSSLTQDDLPKSAKRRSTNSPSLKKSRNYRKGQSVTMKSRCSKMTRYRAKTPPMLIFEAAEL